MKTKTEIVQRLLNEKQIDAEEAITLLMSDKEIQFIPYPQPYPYPTPYHPISPIWVYDPNSQPIYQQPPTMSAQPLKRIDY